MDGPKENGVALIIVLMTTLLMMVLGASLILITSAETSIAANFRASRQAFYAADAALEWAVGDLPSAAQWNSVLSGAEQSSFTDGLTLGVRRLADGTTLDLVEITNLANCQKASTCSDADMDAATTERPWGANNPRWVPYAYGPLEGIAPAVLNLSPFYVVVFVGDDGSENDDDPMSDGSLLNGQPNAGLGLLFLRAEAFGPRGAHRVIEATIARNGTDPTGAVPAALRVLSWREAR